MTEKKSNGRFQFALRDLLLIILACAAWVAILPPCMTLRSFDDRFDSTFRYPLSSCVIALGLVLFSSALSLLVTASPKIDAGARSRWLLLALIGVPLFFLILVALPNLGAHGDSAAYFAKGRMVGLVMGQEMYHRNHGEYSPSLGNLDSYTDSGGGSWSKAEGFPSQPGVRPIDGYVFRIIKAQGSHAPGGPKSYLTTDKNGKERMTEGFAIIAIPASGERGIVLMIAVCGESTLLVGKALGPDALKIASQIVEFDPDESWIPVRR